jgi:hypothetical protein
MRGIRVTQRAAWSSADALDLYTEGAGIESRREHVMSRKFQRSIISPSRKTPRYNLDQAIIANKSFKIYPSPQTVTTP